MIRAILFLLAMIGGVSSVQAQAYMNFKCAGGGGFSLIFEKAGTALVMIDGGALRLQKRKAASGLWYASLTAIFALLAQRRGSAWRAAHRRVASRSARGGD